MELPIAKERDRIIRAVKDNQVTVVVGETGSGKTTQIPVFLHEAGFAEEGIIGITEPRRIAAISTARYVAGKLNSRLGDLVGYQVRFDEARTSGTEMKFMTDGILLREFQNDPELRRYSAIVIDEAHERSRNIDFVLGLLKDLLRKRDDLKVVVASATIDEQKFSDFFGGAPVINVSGRMFPVDVVWSVRNADEYNVVDMTVDTITRIHQNEPDGDILAFLPGESEIRNVIGALEEKGFHGLVALPVFAALPWEDQQKIFAEYPGKRKVIAATNIAETSITIDGIVYVVDSGLIKQNNFHPDNGIESLDVVAHSKSGCEQRKGRAGRTRPGKCYRLFSRDNFDSRPQFTEPEILRTSLAGVILTMKDIGIDDVESFDFVDPPSRQAFHEAYQTLVALGAIRRGRHGLTDIGKSMASLPLEPRISRMLLEAEKYGCTKDVAVVAAFMSGNGVFVRPKDKEGEAEAAHAKFKDASSDIISFLNVWDEYVDSGFSGQWCYENFLNARALREIDDVSLQLINILEERGIQLSDGVDDDSILRAVAVGLAYNLMEKKKRHAYEGVLREISEPVFIHPGSSVFGSFGSRWIIAAEIVRTTKTYARGCTIVKPEWLPEVAPNHYRYGDPVITEHLEKDNKAIMSRPVIDSSGVEVGRTRELVSIEDAGKIQDKVILAAREKGLVKLTFRREDGRSTQFVADTGGLGYRTYYPVEEGRPYYCRPIDPFADRIRGRRDIFSRVSVEPVFRIFSFIGPEIAARATPVGVENLAKKWGGSLKKI